MMYRKNNKESSISDWSRYSISTNWNLASTERCPNAGFMLSQGLRRWANIEPALDQRLVLTRKATIWRKMSDPICPKREPLSKRGLTVLVPAREGQSKHKHLYNICTMLDLRRWADVVQMLYKCFVFAETASLPQKQISINRRHDLFLRHPSHVDKITIRKHFLISIKRNSNNVLFNFLVFINLQSQWFFALGTKPIEKREPCKIGKCNLCRRKDSSLGIMHGLQSAASQSWKTPRESLKQAQNWVNVPQPQLLRWRKIIKNKKRLQNWQHQQDKWL